MYKINIFSTINWIVLSIHRDMYTHFLKPSSANDPAGQEDGDCGGWCGWMTAAGTVWLGSMRTAAMLFVWQGEDDRERQRDLPFDRWQIHFLTLEAL
jgi:heme O synthase-like polyprenyltransferase